jgi:hypothetical protein
VAEHLCGAAVGLRKAQQHAKQRRFPGTIRAHESMDAAVWQTQRQVIECNLVLVLQAERLAVDGVVAHAVFRFV